jgi:site-specific DNA-methyltransferase (adenine-specific)
MTFRILQGDNRDTLKTLADNSIDAIVTDPPYGIDFLGKAWDANTGALETYQECLRVLKPGGHILAFSAARTYHHLAVTLEQAGFEIRDQIMWIYSSGFPKSQDIGRSIQRSLGVKEYYTLEEYEKLTGCTNLPSGNDTLGHYNQGDGHKSAGLSGKVAKVTDPEALKWEGWGTALKPAHEPIALARKPLHKSNSIARNCQQWGTGALNIDATRISYAENDSYKPGQVMSYAKKVIIEQANSEIIGKDAHEENTGWVAPELGRFPSNVLGEILQADYQKYFYCPKVSRRERHVGFELPPAMFGGVQGCYDENGERYAVGLDARTDSNKGNNHPTVKPVELMKYLIKLVTPPGGIVLDPFNGSGSTGMAAVELGYDYIGCELDPAYVEIAQRRIQAWQNKDCATNNYGDLFE